MMNRFVTAFQEFLLSANSGVGVYLEASFIRKKEPNLTIRFFFTEKDKQFRHNLGNR